MDRPSLDKMALDEALPLMGEFGWPTVLLGLITSVGYIATPFAVLYGQIPLIAGMLIIAVCVYALYTVMHDSVHGAICGRHRHWQWLNNGLGYLAGFVFGIPFTAHRSEHITHHRHTNDPELDPDYQVSNMKNSPWQAVKSAGKMVFSNYTYYFSVRWSRAGLNEKSWFVGEVVVAVAARVVCFVLFFEFWWQLLLLLVVAPIIGVIALIYLFAYIVHHPHTAKGRYVDTSTIEVAGGFNTIVTWLWLYQNYHSIHHLFPKVPFYRYRQLFNRIEPIMREKGAPIYQLTLIGLKTSASESNGVLSRTS